MKYIIATLGCKVNQFETQAMEECLRRDGHRPAEPGEQADAVIVNTCAVTAESGRKSRQTIRRLRDENPGALVAVCGCYAQLSPEENAEIGADVLFGTGDRMAFVEAVERAVGQGEGEKHIDRPFSRRKLELLPAGAVSGRTRAMLKVQDGCRNFCSYCIIPYVRGSLRSMSIEDAVSEVRRIRDEGFRELVLTGIEVASYGLDLEGKPTLTDLVEAAAAEAGDMRLRLGSLEPTVITEDFCRRLAATGKLCRHFHLSLQSGCDRTLKAMNRKYDTAFFFDTTERLRRYFPGCALTAPFQSCMFFPIRGGREPRRTNCQASRPARSKTAGRMRPRRYPTKPAALFARPASGKSCRFCLKPGTGTARSGTATPICWCASPKRVCTVRCARCAFFPQRKTEP